MFEDKTEQEAQQEILALVEEYAGCLRKKKGDFHPGDRVSYTSRIYDRKEAVNATGAIFELWLTSGRYTDLFERKSSAYLDVPFMSLVGPGSDANLFAFIALTSPKLGERRAYRGGEIITVAYGSPTTVTPMLQYGAAPVSVDVAVPQYSIDMTKLETVYSPKTKTAMIAHTLGNPFDLKAVKQFCDAHGLWPIEDDCDTLDSRYTLGDVTQFTSTIGGIDAPSFCPPHHMTMGEDGAIHTKSIVLHNILHFMRDWGRDCRCPSGVGNLCGHRFGGQCGELLKDYDHEYVYSEFGFNLKVTDLQVSIDCVQPEEFLYFVGHRKENFKRPRAALASVMDELISPETCENADLSWFDFLLTCQEGVSHEKLARYIESKGVQTHMLSAGNLTKHSCFDMLRASGEDYRIVGELTKIDRIMRDTFWVGVYPGMMDETINYMTTAIREGLTE